MMDILIMDGQMMDRQIIDGKMMDGQMIAEMDSLQMQINGIMIIQKNSQRMKLNIYITLVMMYSSRSTSSARVIRPRE